MVAARVFATVFRTGVLLAGVLCLSGCQSSGGDRADITSTYPLDRVRAVVRSAEAGDAEVVDLLIELLDDSDRGVRMYAILALERLCGEDHGYRYYAPEAERAAAIARWRAARQRGEVVVRTTSGQPAEAGAVGASPAARSEQSSQ
jgi:HEAT repeat protein